MWRAIGGISLVFKVWMFLDAMRRDVRGHWFWLITVVPFGEWVYFFAVKMRDHNARRVVSKVRDRLAPRASLDELRHKAARTPSIVNRVRFGQGLYDAGEFAEAAREFEAVLAARPDDLEALYGIGLTRLALDDCAGAIDPLAAVVDGHAFYRDYAAYGPLAEAYFGVGERELAVSVMRARYRQAPRMIHAVDLARALCRAGVREAAHQVLADALADRATDPFMARLRSYRDARVAEAFMRELAPVAGAVETGVEEASSRAAKP